MNTTLLYHHHRGSDIVQLFLPKDFSAERIKEIKKSLESVSEVLQVLNGAKHQLIVERRVSILKFIDFLATIRHCLRENFQLNLEVQKNN